MKDIATKCILFLISSFLVILNSSQVFSAIFCVGTASELSTALSTATSNGEDDIIRVQQGTYNGNFIYASTEAFGVTIEGGYSSGCTSRVVDPINTVLDGQNTNPVLVLSNPAESANYTIEGLTFRNGFNNSGNGGGLFIRTIRGMVTIQHSIIRDNTVSDTYYEGGGIYVQGPATLTLRNNLFFGNTGTGILATVCENINLVENTITYNQGRTGGALVDASNTATIDSNTFERNTGREVGGIYVHGNNGIMFKNNILTDNIAEEWGGGVNAWGAVPMYIEGNIITKNNGGLGGGVNVNNSGKVVLRNNIIANNNAIDGGGVFMSREMGPLPETNLINNTIYNNSADASGGGIYIRLVTNTDITNIFNNIIYSNNASTGSDIYILNDGNGDYLPSIVNLFNNNFNQNIGGYYFEIPFTIDPSNLNNADPLFVDPENDDFHLTSDSPLIDMGNNSAPQLPSKDKDGKPRIIDGNYDNIAYVDIGAYEFGSPRGDLDGDGDVDGEDLRIFAESYGTYVGP